ncbi:MAG: FAD-binding oxidoreductase [Cyclobacteriaceae bacterium]
MDKLQSLLGADKVLNGDDLKERFFHVWQMNEPVRAKAVILPRTTEDVSNIMKLCHEYDQPVVVHGGLTNLVGSTETNGDEIIISTEKMNQIEEVDEQSRTMTLQSGVILENVHRAAEELGLFFPMTFGSKGSAQMGGVISTNAGGMRVFRYGMTRNLILGLEVVLPDGTVLSSMKKIIKDNSGYDLKQLFVGSEGTLGIVTRAVLKLEEKPTSRNSALIACNDYNNVVSLLKLLDNELAGTLSAFELLWEINYRTMTTPPSPYNAPLPLGYEYYILVEALGIDAEYEKERLEKVLEQALVDGIIEDALVAQSLQNHELFWNLRENVDVLQAQHKFNQYFDISLPIPLIGDYVVETSERIREIDDVDVCYVHGHVADGNIHFHVGKSNYNQSLTDEINEVVYAPLKKLGGSVSAEHGIGLHKKKYLHLCRSEEEIQLMRQLKSTFDPKGILNPGRVVDV